MWKCQMWTSKMKLWLVKGTCRGIWAITPKFPVQTSSRQSRTEENRCQRIWHGRWILKEEPERTERPYKLIELACAQLNRAWEQLIEKFNHREFQALCEDDEDLHEADTRLLESQALVDELICRTVHVDYSEVKLHSGEMVSKGKTSKFRTEGTDNSWITTFGRPGKKSSSKTTSAVSR